MPKTFQSHNLQMTVGERESWHHFLAMKYNPENSDVEILWNLHSVERNHRQWNSCEVIFGGMLTLNMKVFCYYRYAVLSSVCFREEGPSMEWSGYGNTSCHLWNILNVTSLMLSEDKLHSVLLKQSCSSWAACMSLDISLSKGLRRKECANLKMT